MGQLLFFLHPVSEVKSGLAQHPTLQRIEGLSKLQAR